MVLGEKWEVSWSLGGRVVDNGENQQQHIKPATWFDARFKFDSMKCRDAAAAAAAATEQDAALLFEKGRRSLALNQAHQCSSCVFKA